MQYTTNYNYSLPESDDVLETASRVGYNNNFSDIDTQIKDANDDIDSIGEEVDTISTQISAIDTQIGTINTQIGAIDTRVDTLETHDYIVEQGTSDDWEYRKWNSGKAELWLKNYQTGSPTQTSQGNLFQELYTLNKNFPFPLVNTPFTLGNAATSDTHGLVQNITASTTKITTIHAYRGNSGSYPMRLNIYVMGNWK